MALNYNSQNTFAGGELAPSLHARTDLAKYSTGLKIARNGNILPQGGFINRAGTYRVATAGDSSHKVRGVPFVYADGQSYNIEFGEKYIRMYKDGLPIAVGSTYLDFNPVTAYVAGSFCKVSRHISCYRASSGARLDLYSTAPETGILATPIQVQFFSGGASLVVTVVSDVNISIELSTTPSDNSADKIQAALRAANANYAAWFVCENAAYAAARPTSAAGYTFTDNGNTAKYFMSRLAVVGNATNTSLFPLYETTYWIDGSNYGIPSPYLSAELFDLKFTQSADYLYIFHPDHAPMQLVRVANNSWLLSVYNFKNGPFMLSNTNIGRTLVSNSATPAYSVDNTISTLAPGYPPYPGAISDYMRLETSAAHGLSTGDTVKISAIVNAAFTYLNGNVYSVEVVDTTKFYLCYPWTTTRILVSSFATVTLAAGKASAIGPSTITANFPLFDALHVGALFEMVETIPAQTITDATFDANTHVTASIKCGRTWRLITSGTWGGSLSVQVSTDGAVTWKSLRTLSSNGTATVAASNYDTSGDTGAPQCLIRVAANDTQTWYGAAGALVISLSSDTFDWHGIVQIVTVSSDTVATANIITEPGVGIGLASTNATYLWSEGSWSNYRGWPTCGTFYQDRFCIASTASEPQTVWMSQTGDYVNFGVSFPLVDSDAISALLPSRTVNIVKNMAVLGSLVVLTSDSDFSIEPGNGGVLSPTSINITCHGHRGTSGVTPAIVGNELILVQQMGSVIRNLIYQFSVNGYMGDDIIVMAKHLLTGHSIVEMAFQQEPDSILWAVRDDGKLLSLTYMREQEMLAWSLHDTDGLFESVSVIPNSTLGINEVWFVVNRGGVRFIERMAKRYMGDDPADYMILDCAVTQDNGSSPSATVTGLSHLEGKTVNALHDGFVARGLVVASGSVTLPATATLAHVGLPYITDLETLRIDSPTPNGTSQSRRIAIPEVTIRFVDSRGGWIKAMAKDIDAPAATGVVGFDEMLEHDSVQVMSAAMPLKTTDYKVTMNGGYDFGAGIFFRQIDPLPVTIISIIPKVIVSEN